MRQRRTGATVRPDHPTKQRLVEVAAREIVAVGVEKVQLDVVLAEVGVSKGALYHHFGASQTPERRSFRSLRLHTLSLVRTQPDLASKIADRQAELTDLMADASRKFQERGWSRPGIDPHAVAVLIQAMNLGRIVDDVVEDSRRVDPQSWIDLFSVVLDSFFIVE